MGSEGEYKHTSEGREQIEGLAARTVERRLLVGPVEVGLRDKVGQGGRVGVRVK